MNRLEAIATKLGNGVTADSLKTAVANASPLEMNTFINELFNKVLLSSIFKRTIFTNPLAKYFIQEGSSISSHKEVVDSKLLTASTFDVTKRFADTQQKSKTLSVILSTIVKEYIQNTINHNYAKSAFASEASFNSWIEKQMEVITETFNIRLYNVMTSVITESVKNKISVPTSVNTYDLLFEFINTLVDTMFFPTNAFNLGYESKLENSVYKIKNTTDEEFTRINSLKREDVIIIMSPEVKNVLDARVSSIKFHNQYFNVGNYSYVLVDNSILKNYIYILDKKAFQGYFRIQEVATQYWPANLTSENYFHYWLVFGAIPWANGVKIEVPESLRA